MTLTQRFLTATLGNVLLIAALALSGSALELPATGVLVLGLLAIYGGYWLGVALVRVG